MGNLRNIPSKFKEDTEKLIIENYYKMTLKQLIELTGVDIKGPELNFVIKKNNNYE